MATKKPASKKPVPAKAQRSGLTSAIGPKATTMLVICTITGGLVVGELQRSQPTNEAQTMMVPVGTAGTDDAVPAPVAKPAAKTPAAKAAPGAPFVTIAGCLERNDEAFRLKDTAGAEAPKARSWKSGFLKKASASIAVVNGARAVPLADHVGRRVSVTGTLAGREMKASSVRRLAASCS